MEVQPVLLEPILALFVLLPYLGVGVALLLIVIALRRSMKAQEAMARSLQRIERMLDQNRQ